MYFTTAVRLVPHWTPLWTSAGARGFNWRCWSTAAIGSCRSGPDYVGKNIPSAATEDIRVRLAEDRQLDEVVIIKRVNSMLNETITVPKSTAWRHLHVLDVDDFKRDEFELVFQTADAMSEILSRPIKKVPALRGQTVVNLFYENSTRTRASFEIAAKNLSADVLNVTSTASSIAKGESLIDTLKTLEALGANIIVMRHNFSGAPYLAARHSKPTSSTPAMGGTPTHPGIA